MALKLPNLPKVKLPFNVPRINLGPRARKILRYVGLGVFALVVFVFALQLSFPYDRVRDKVIEAMQEKYEVSIGEVERGIWPGRVYFKNVTIRTRQTKPEETVTTFFIKDLQLDVGIMSMIAGNISLDLDATIGPGHLTGSIKMGKFGKGDLSAEFEGENLPAGGLPMRGIVGLPMSGKLAFDFSLFLPMEKAKMGRTSFNWQKARGSLALSCPGGCTFGDGKTKLKPLLKNTRQQMMVQEGIDFGKVTMDKLEAKATIKNGKLTLDKFDTKSKDGEIKVDFMLTLERDITDSMVTGCLRFKGSDDLLVREPRTHAAISTTGAERRADGFFHIRLTDRFKDMKKLNQECGPGVSGTGNGEDFSRTRPSLTVMPESPGSGMATTPPVPPPMMDAMPAMPTMDAGIGSSTPTVTPMTNEGPPQPPPPREGAGRDHGPGSGTGTAAPPAAAPGSATGAAAPPPEGG